jgi:hypothetical protein
MLQVPLSHRPPKLLGTADPATYGLRASIKIAPRIPDFKTQCQSTWSYMSYMSISSHGFDSTGLVLEAGKSRRLDFCTTFAQVVARLGKIGSQSGSCVGGHMPARCPSSIRGAVVLNEDFGSSIDRRIAR